MDHIELLQAQAHIWNHIFNFINSMSLKCAINLGIPDIIHKNGKPMKLSDLISALPIHPTKAHGVYRLMRILIHSGFFALQKLSKNDQQVEEEEEEEGYVLTPTSLLLLKDNPMSATPFLLAMLDPILTGPWHCVSDWFQNDVATPFQTRHGRGFWGSCEDEPGLNNLFNDGMASDARLVSRIVLQENRDVFEGLKTLVDVAGGTGTVARAIADAFPNLDCTVFDLPHVVVGLKDNENLKYVGGDMFVGPVPPADAILLKWILHDWNDEECVKILKNCKEAITQREGGKVIIIEMVMMEKNKKGENEELIETQVFFDMLMMIMTTGQERKEDQWAKLFSDAGFSGYKITPILGLRSLIEVYP